MWCWLFGHIYDDQNFTKCARCQKALPAIEDEPTFEEGYEYGIKVASDRLLSFADKIEAKYNTSSTHWLREAAHKLRWDNSKWYEE